MTLMTTSNAGIDAIKKWEQFLPKGVYLSFNGVREKYPTIGWGHNGPDVKTGEYITQEAADELLHKDLTAFEQEVNALGKNLTQAQFDALVSWIYNLGTGNFRSSTLRKKILSEAPDEQITDQMVRWVRARGQVLLGLKKRRVAEANMFLGTTLYYIDKNEVICKRR